MTSQPNPLPKTLPKGTCTTYRHVATSQLALRHGGYVGEFDSIASPMYFHAVTIDWSTVPAAATPECACGCGAPADAVYDCESIPGLADCHGEPYAESCRAKGGLVTRIHARRASKDSTGVPAQASATAGPPVSNCVVCGASGALFSATECGHCHLRIHGSEENQRRQMDLRGAPARGRLAAMDRAELTRVNPAQRKQMQAGHPAAWPSNEEED